MEGPGSRCGEAPLIGPVRRFWLNESGATIVEHAIMACAAALVAVALVASDLTPSRALHGVGYIADTLFSGEDLGGPPTPKPGLTK